MIKTIKNATAGLIVATLLVVGSVGTVGIVASPVGAQYTAQDGADAARATDVPGTLFGTNDSIFTVAVNLMLYVIGAISVIMLIVGGIRYTTSNGAEKQITTAKNTIMYAIIGLVVAFLAYAIVNWLLGSLAAAS